jgi:tetratricopeptide (TPR) repeat protein
MALLGLLLFVAGLCLVPLQETDIFFRLAHGQQILASGSIPGRNLFSFTFPNHPYLDSAWLFDAGAAGIHRLGGFPALVVAKTSVVLLVFAAAFLVLRRRGLGSISAALALAAAAFCMRDRLVERPHVFSLLGEVALIALLPALREGRRRAWWLIPLVAVWASFHAGAFLGPLLLGMVGVGWLAQGILVDHKVSRRVLLAHALAAGLCTLAMMATPVGPGIFHYLGFHSDIFAIHPVDEFRAVSWQSDVPLLIFAAGLLVLLGVGAWRRGFVPACDLVPVIGLGILAGRTVRFGADFVLVGTLLLAPLWSRLTARWSDRVAPALRAQLERASAALLVVLALVPRMSVWEKHGPFFSIDLDRSSLPLAALDFVERNRLRDRMYNDFETGSFLIWQGFPRFRVFVDPRLPAYPRAFHELLGRADISREEWTRAMDRLGVQSALIDYAGINRRVAWWAPEDWALVFRAHDTRVFVRRTPAHRDLIARAEIPASYDFSLEEGAATLPLLEPPAASPVPACEWQLRLGDLLFDLDHGHSPRALSAYRQALAASPGCLAPEREASASAWLGAVERSAGRAAEALALFDRSLALIPGDTSVLTNRALVLESLGRSSEAAQAWSRVAQAAAGTPLGERAKERVRALVR